MDTMNESNAFQIFAGAAGGIMNPEIEKWKNQGGKIVGYFCSAMPAEMLTAGGILPFRIRATGSTGTELSDSYFSNLNCSFPRHAFNLALKGEYDFLDGTIFFNSCDHIRRIYDHWIRQLKTKFVRILSLPKKAEQPQVEWFRKELANLREGLETHFDTKISDGRLWDSIKLYNENRRLLRQLSELRKGEQPPITGAEALTVTVAGMALPADRYNQLLKEFLGDISGRALDADFRARLMVVGGELDDPEYIKVIEGQGGLVVADSLCFGSRLFWQEVNESIEDPLLALAQYYVADRPSCARVFTEYESRSQYIKQMMEEFNVDGLIFERLVFCESWGFEQYSLTGDAKEWGVPLLCMDREYILSGVGQLRTRVQALLETMEK